MIMLKRKDRAVCCVCYWEYNDPNELLSEKAFLWKRYKQPQEFGILLEAKSIRYGWITIDLLDDTCDHYPLFTNRWYRLMKGSISILIFK